MKFQIKIKSRLLLPLLLLVCFPFFLLEAQTNDLEAPANDLDFNIVTGSNGVLLGKINGMTRDKYGYMWFSDQSNRCIIRYDGTKMTKYKNDPSDSNSLGGSYPECLFADPSGIIWIGFYGQGLDRFDPHTNTFTHYRHDDSNPESLSNNVVSAVLVDHLGNVWVGNNGGLDLLDQKTGKFKHFNHKDNDTTSLSHNVVRSIYEDHEGSLWVGTGFEFDSSNDLGGLNRFDRKTRTFTQYLHDPENPNSLINNKVRAIYEDSQGTFWIGTAGDGLHTMDRKNGTFKRLTYDPIYPDRLSRPAVINDADHITFITEDVQNELWIGTLLNGLLRYNLETKKFIHYTNFNGGKGNNRDDTTWWANCSPDGIVWLSTQSAILYKTDLFQRKLPHFGSQPSDALFAFCEGPESVQWMATANGLIRKDPNKGTEEIFKNDYQNPDSLINIEISDLLAEKNGEVWVATTAGLNRFDYASRKFVHYLNETGDGGKPIDVRTFVKDKDSTIWLGAYLDGLIHFDPWKNQVINIYIANTENRTSLYTNFITTMLMDSSTHLWIGMLGALDKLDIDSGKFKHYLEGLNIFCLYKDNEENFWAGTSGGLYRYSKELDDFIIGSRINEALDFPNVFSLVEDQNNNLWLTSSPGLYKINPKRNYVNFFSKDYGISQGNSFNNNAAFQTKSGSLIFGDDSGYFMFKPEEFSDILVASDIWFSGFSLNNKVILPGANSVLQNPIITTDKIDLAYDQNAFSFDFSVINYRGNNNIQYQLENYDKNWRTSGSENRADYFRVPPGDYSMHIKLINYDDENSLVKSIVITISPPWWQTWWAYIIYVLIFISGVFLVDRYQRKRLLEKARAQAKEKELEQAREIERAYNELKTTQAQLIHSEKMASLGELTAGIAHEIQNPLNFVNNFSEVSKELLEEMMEEIKKGETEEIETLAKDIIENLEKITHHGKRADGIVKGMLQHSRTSTGIKEPTDINVLADEYLRLAYHGLRAKDKSFNAIMKTDFDESIGKIDVIPQDIGRVILNLITNAFYAVTERKTQLENVTSAEAYEPTVIVSTKKTGNNVEIRVKDNGNGIPKSLIDKIFQPFFTTKPTGAGTGLGLSLSYDIIQAHGGEISVNSLENEGTEFTIRLVSS